MRLPRRSQNQSKPQPQVRVVPASELRKDETISSLIAKGAPRSFGPHFDALVEAIDWELSAQLALRTLGDTHPSREQIHNLAFLVADEVDWRFKLTPRVPPGEEVPGAKSR